jgi:hypothetical protein
MQNIEAQRPTRPQANFFAKNLLLVVFFKLLISFMIVSAILLIYFDFLQ